MVEYRVFATTPTGEYGDWESFYSSLTLRLNNLAKEGWTLVELLERPEVDLERSKAAYVGSWRMLCVREIAG